MSPHAVGRRPVHRSVALGMPLAVLAAFVVAGTAGATPDPPSRGSRTPRRWETCPSARSATRCCPAR